MLRRVVPSWEESDLVQTVAAMRRTVPATPDLELAETPSVLPERWTPQRFHPEQSRGFHSSARFRVFEAGRRSGKTEGRKREIALKALDLDWMRRHGLRDRYIVVGAPTQQQAVRLYWRDLQRLIPARFIREVRTSFHEIETVTGALVRVLGMDAPQRAEGDPIDDLYLDEFADMRREVYYEHLRGSLSTPGRPPGTATIFGTPDMSKGAHFVELCEQAVTEKFAGLGWEYFHWSSRGVIDETEWAEARESMPADIFAVEYEAKRVAIGDRIYYPFDRYTHGVRGLVPMANRPLIICHDFNWNPATATIAQEQCVEDYDGVAIDLPDDELDGDFTAVLDEVFLRRAYTIECAREVVERVKRLGHTGPVHVYGDATGGLPKSSAIGGSDIDLLRQVYGPAFGDRVTFRFRSSNPAERSRVNAVNARLRNAEGWVRLVVERERCRELIADFEQVTAIEGSSGAIDKRKDDARTHLSDGLGYYIASMFPVRERETVEQGVRY